MIRWFRAFLYAALALIVLLVIGTAVVVWTPVGLNLALSLGERYLPEPLDLGEVEGTLGGGLTLHGGGWRDGKVTVEVAELSFRLAPLPLLRADITVADLRADGVRVDIRDDAESAQVPERSDESFRLSMPMPLAVVDGVIRDVTITVRGQSRSVDRIELSAGADGPELQVQRLSVESDWLIVAAAGEGEMQSPYRLRLQAEWTWRSADGRVIAGRGSLRGDRSSWDLDHRLEQPERIRSRGTLSNGADGFRADLVNSWERIAWALPGGRSLVTEEGRLSIKGWLDDFRFGATGRAKLDDLPLVEVELAGRGDTQRLEFASLRGVSEAGVLTGKGSLRLTPRISWDGDFQARDLRPRSWGLPLDGELSARGSFDTGWTDDGELRLQLGLRSLDGNYRGSPLQAEGDLTLAGGRLRMQHVDLRVGVNRLRADGWVETRTPGTQVALDLDLEVPRLEDLHVGAQGAVAGRLSLSGAVTEPVVGGRLEGQNVRWSSAEATRLTLLGLPGEGAMPPTIRVEVTDARLAGRDLASLTAELRGGLGDSRIAMSAEVLDTQFELTAEGGLTEDRWKGVLLAFQARHRLLGEWTLADPAPLAIGRGAASLDQLCLAAEGAQSLCLEGEFGAESGIVARVQADSLPLGLLGPLLEPQGLRIEGSADARVDVSYLDGRLDGEARLRASDAVLGARLPDEESVDWRIDTIAVDAAIDSNRTRIDAQLDLGEQGGSEASIEFADILDPAAGLSGRLEASLFDIGFVSLLFPELHSVRGEISADVDLTGTRQAPRLDGYLRLRDGAFDFLEAGISITEIQVTATQAETGLLEYQGSARSGAGRVAIRGTTQRRDDGWVTVLTLRGEQFLLVQRPDIRVTASPDLRVSVDPSRVSVAGTVEVPEADITVKEVGPGAVKSSPDVVVHGGEQAEQPGFGPRLDVELDVVLGDAVELQGFGLKTSLGGSIRLTGGSDSPWLGYGRLTLIDATYRAYGQNLDVERGELLFSGPLDNPALDIRATREAGDVLAGVQISGTVRTPQSTLFSEPALPEAEALSYLLTGRPLTGASGGDRSLLAQAALGLGLSQAGSLAAQMRQGVGLDTLAVEGGTTDGRVLAGKWLGPDLYVQYAWGIFDQIGTLLVRYDLSDRLQLESRSGEQHSVDLIYSVEGD